MPRARSPPTSCAATQTELLEESSFFFPFKILGSGRVGGEAEAADSSTMLVKKHAGKGGGREAGSEDPRQRCAWTVPPCTALAALLSVVAVMSCLYLGVKTNDLQARIAVLESAKGDPSIHLFPDCRDQLKAMVQEKVEQLLAQV